jgi:hexulose-6-phosphate isomerase
LRNDRKGAAGRQLGRVARRERTCMKKAINYWAHPPMAMRRRTIDECIAHVSAAGFDAVELNVTDDGELPLKSTEKDCAAIRRKLDKAGLEIASLSSRLFWKLHIGSPRAAERNRAEKATKHMLKLAKWLGTDVLKFIPGAVSVFYDADAEIIPYDILYARSRQGIQRLVRHAEAHGVTLCIENVLNHFLVSPLEMRDFIDSFESQYVAAYLDTANVLAYGYPEHWIRILAKRIRRVHLTDAKFPVRTATNFCDLLTGDVNWPAVMKAFRTVGYEGYITAETVPIQEHALETRLRNMVNAMTTILSL